MPIVVLVKEQRGRAVMSERSNNEVVEGGTVEHWPPLDPRDRTVASPTEGIFQKILKELEKIFGPGKET